MKASASRLLIAAAALLIGVAPVMAQAWDDDIYFNADKAKKEASTKKEAAKKEAARRVSVTSYPAADTYVTVTTGSTRDIDEYNRRGIFAVPDTTAAAPRSGAPSAADGDAFANTRRIERFYNPDVVIENPDGSVAEYYYATDPVDVNIYINGGYPSYSPFYDPWYYSSWNWGPAWSWTWGPSWSWSWGWGTPAWGWGPSWSWGWGGPAWGWGPSWGWGGPAWGWGGPVVSPGFNRPPSYRPGHSSYNNMAGSYRRANAAAAGSYRGGSNYNATTTTAGRRASSDSRWNVNTVGTANPNRGQSAAGSSAGRRPAGSSYRGTTGTATRDNNSSRTSTYRSSGSNATTSRSSSSSSSGSWRSSGSSSSRSSSAGSSGSYRSSGSSFGGGRSSGGGGGGGRRR